MNATPVSVERFPADAPLLPVDAPVDAPRLPADAPVCQLSDALLRGTLTPFCSPIPVAEALAPAWDEAAAPSSEAAVAVLMAPDAAVAEAYQTAAVPRPVAAEDWVGASSPEVDAEEPLRQGRHGTCYPQPC